MDCPNCGKENPGGAQLCRSCGRALMGRSSHPEGAVTKTSRLAIAAFVLGILGVTAIPAIILGIVSLIRIDKSGGRLSGRGFAILGIVLPVIVLPILLSMVITVPALDRVNAQRRAIVCRSNLRQWGLLLKLYTDDYDGYFFSGSDGDMGQWWMKPTQPYHRDSTELFLCPMATKPYTEGGRNPFGAWEADGYLGSYGPNGWICNPEPNKASVLGHGPAENCWKSAYMKGANNVPEFLDCMWFEGWPEQTDDPPPDEDWPKTEVDQAQMDADQDEMRRFCMNRHEESVNALFADWSVRSVGPKELWTLKWHRNYNTSGPRTRAGGARPGDWPEWMRRFRDY